MISLRNICDDFFTIGEIAILQQHTWNDRYDFAFRNHFECKSIVSDVNVPVFLHIGAVNDYNYIQSTVESLGMELLVDENEHLRCSMIEKWYPLIAEKTPATKVYETFPTLEEVLRDFSFPIFIKGNRQTSGHKRSKCIVENASQYEALRKEWKRDSTLSWQKVAIREFIPLQVIDSESFPDMVPISREFRFFYFEGKCMAYGPYWYMAKNKSLSEEELREVLQLTDWAASRIHAVFPAIDVAKTAGGEWIIIEVNDAQESGYVGVNPFELWNNTISAMQERTWLPAQVPPGKEIDLEHFARIFNHEMKIGVYPQVYLIFNDDVYEISADYENVYFLRKHVWVTKLTQTDSSTAFTILPKNSEVLLFISASLEELLSRATIEGKTLISVWDQLRFIPFDDDYEYRFSFKDWVYVKSINSYGVVKETPSDTGESMTYGISLEGTDWLEDSPIKVKEDDLEYDERPETMEELREAYQDFLDRVSDC